jgi:hypothetical protein
MLNKIVLGYFYITTLIGIGLFALIAYNRGGGTNWVFPIGWFIMCAFLYCFSRFYIQKKTTGPFGLDVLPPQMQKSVYSVIAHGLLVLEPTLGIILGIVTLLRSSGTS